MRKRIYIILAVILSVSLSTNLFAKKSVLIDFNKLKANGNGTDAANSLADNDPKMADIKDHDPKNRVQHMPTLLDYSAIAGSNYTKDEVKQMATSLACYNWVVAINSSAAFIENQKYSYCKEWHTKYVPVLGDDLIQPASTTSTTTTNNQAAAPEGYTILGIRIHFPETPFNNWALIKPPFEIPAYENITTDYKGNVLADADMAKLTKGSKYDNYGVIKNVGIIKSMDLRIYGCQFKNSISILLKDDQNIITEYPMQQYLDFDGWRKITWTNPNYIDEAANRDLYVVPLYPRSTPYIKFIGFRICRQGEQYGGDFVTYVKDIVVTYDEAILERENLPIIHEDAWHILQDRTIQAKNRELNSIGNNQILIYLEKKKMHKETSSN